ncbi:hypothetical protein MASR1M32_10260 [Rhodobacter sp.]
MAADLKAAAAFVPDLQALIDAIPVIDYRSKAPSDYQGQAAATERLVATISEMGGKVSRNGSHETRVRLFGLSASSTSGVKNACRNWINQIRSKAGEI